MKLMLGHGCINKKCGYIFDLDGVLVKGKQRNSAITLLEKAEKKGVVVSFCTGRGKDRTIKLTQNVATNKTIFVANGGATFVLNTEIIYEKLMSKEEKKIAVKTLYHLIDQNLFFINACLKNGKGYIYYSNNNMVRQNLKRSEYEAEKVFDDYAEFSTILLSCDIVKITVIFNKSVSEENEKVLEVKGFYCGDSESHCYYCIASGINKYTAVKFLIEKYGLEKVYYFGNDKNDIPVFDSNRPSLIKVYVYDGNKDNILFGKANYRVRYEELYGFIDKIMEE